MTPFIQIPPLHNAVNLCVRRHFRTCRRTSYTFCVPLIDPTRSHAEIAHAAVLHTPFALRAGTDVDSCPLECGETLRYGPWI